MLVVGPLQAQSVFACSMMDTVMHGDCCCVGQKSDDDCIDGKCGGAGDASTSPCCERSVEISVDVEAQQNTPIATAAEVRSDVDPPPPIIAYSHEIVPRQLASAVRIDYSHHNVCHSGSDTYLVTQRLRI